MRVKEIYIHNFKSFKDCFFPLHRFNIVVAPNNAGKSNLIDALKFFKLFVRRGPDSAINSFNGIGRIKNFRSSQSEDILIRIKTDSIDIYFHRENLVVSVELTFQITITVDNNNKDNLLFEEKAIFSGRIKRNTAKRGSYFLLEAKKETKMDKGFKLFKDKMENIEELKTFTIVRLSYTGAEKWRNFLYDSLLNPLPRNVKWKEGDARKTFISEIKDLSIYQKLLNPVVEDVFFNFSTYYFIPRNIKEKVVSGNTLNEEGTNISSVLHFIQKDFPEVFNKISDSLIEIVEEVKEVKVVEDPVFSRETLLFTERNAKKLIPVDVISDGTINLLATITALYEPMLKSLIAIEEPERHLHLKAISYLMETFRDVSENNRQILITTQSSEIMRNVDFETDNIILLFRDYDGNTKAVSHKAIEGFNRKLRRFNYDLPSMIKMDLLGYLGDYIRTEEKNDTARKD